MKRRALLPLVGSLVLLLGSGLGWAGQYDEKERAELARALKGAKVSLKQGIVASAPKGKPISGKFEVEDGKTRRVWAYLDRAEALKAVGLTE